MKTNSLLHLTDEELDLRKSFWSRVALVTHIISQIPAILLIVFAIMDHQIGFWITLTVLFIFSVMMICAVFQRIRWGDLAQDRQYDRQEREIKTTNNKH